MLVLTHLPLYLASLHSYHQFFFFFRLSYQNNCIFQTTKRKYLQKNIEDFISNVAIIMNFCGNFFISLNWMFCLIKILVTLSLIYGNEMNSTVKELFWHRSPGSNVHDSAPCFWTEHERSRSISFYFVIYLFVLLVYDYAPAWTDQHKSISSLFRRFPS